MDCQLSSGSDVKMLGMRHRNQTPTRLITLSSTLDSSKVKVGPLYPNRKQSNPEALCELPYTSRSYTPR